MAEYTVGPGKSYTTLQAAWNAHVTDLTAPSFACYAGELGVLDMTQGTPGFTPSSGSYVRIYPASGNQANGKDPTTGAYIAVDAGNTAIVCGIAYTRIEQLGVLGSGAGNNDSAVSLVDGANNALINGLLLKDCDNNIAILNLTTNLTGWTVQNCLGWFSSGNGQGAIILSVSATSGGLTISCTGSAYNNSFYNCGTIACSPAATATNGASATLVSKNNIVVDGGTCFDATGQGQGGTENATLTNTNCISSDATADDFGGSGNQVSKTAASLFANSATGDLSLALGSPARMTGILITTLANDAIGNPRAGLDVGALQSKKSGGRW